MRVTENFLINLATDAAAKGRDRLAAVGEIAASGVAVNRPSENGVAWAEGTRADARKIMSTSRHSTIARAHERLTTADRSFQTVDDVLQRTIELATQMANGSYGPEQRKYAAIEVRSLRDSAIAAANVQDNNGEFVFAGAQGNKPPFNATGVYQGDAQTNVVETAEHQQQTITLPGTVFTAAAGVNVFDVMTRLAQSMDNNDPTAISNALPTLHTAINQISSARSVAGTRMAALESADSARQDFENTLAETKSRTTDADPIQAASDLSKGKLAMETAQALSQEIMSVMKTFQ